MANGFDDIFDDFAEGRMELRSFCISLTGYIHSGRGDPEAISIARDADITLGLSEDCSREKIEKMINTLRERARLYLINK